MQQPIFNQCEIIYQNYLLVYIRIVADLNRTGEWTDVIKCKIGIEIKEEEYSADKLDKLKLRKYQVPIRPLTQGKLEWIGVMY